MSSIVSGGGIQMQLDRVRKDFPALHLEVYGKPLVYLDNAATTQKPQIVLDTLQRFYRESNSNVHRGIHYLSENATRSFEGARDIVRQFLNAESAAEIIFVRGATEAINLVAQSYGRTSLQEDDEIVVTAMEHHSNIVPWQILCEQTGARLRVVPINDEGELLMEEYEQLLGGRVRLAALNHVSNALGTVNPVKEMIRMAHDAGAVVLLDGAQAAVHTPVDVVDLDCDFYAFSGHKLYGPTGIGVLYGKEKYLHAMPPYQGGGDMISSVTFEKTTYNKLPYKFEAGTPNIAGAIGLGAALEYVRSIGWEWISRHEQDLLRYGTELLSASESVRLIGTAKEKAGVISFVMEGVHPHDIGTVLDREGVAVRAGHHCAMPVMNRFGVPATVRASFGMYNTREEIEILAKSLAHVHEVLGV